MAMMLVTVILTLMMLEVGLLAQNLTRSLGEESSLYSYNQAARTATETAFTRLRENINTYLASNGPTALDTAFAQGSSVPSTVLNNTSISVIDPETGSPITSGITVSAWVASRRGRFVQMRATAVYGNVNLTANRWMQFNTCNAQGTLTTVRSTSGSPLLNAVDATSGRQAFSEGGLGGVGWVWSAGSGLSTLNGGSPLARDPASGGMLYLNGNNLVRWTSSGLTTTLSNVFSNYRSLAVNSTTGQVVGLSSAGGLVAWSPTTGLSTVAFATTHTNFRSAIHALSGRYFLFTNDGGTLGRLHAWLPGTGLSTILENADLAGSITDLSSQIGFDSSSRVYFTNTASSSRVYVWNPGGGALTTIQGGLTSPSLAFVDASNSRVGFGNWLWSVADGLLTLNGGTALAQDPATGGVYYINGNNLVRWISSGVTTTLSSTFTGLPAVNSTSGQVIGRSPTTGLVAWSPTTGLSTVAISLIDSNFREFIDSNTGRYFLFGDNGSTGRLYTWLPGSGVSTLVSRPNAFGWSHGTSALVGADSASRLYFVENSGVNVYSWLAPTCLSLSF
jgi:hypothetical protein